VRRRGLPVTERLGGMIFITGLSREVAAQAADDKDPLRRARHQLAGDPARLEAIEDVVLAETQQVVDRALAEDGPAGAGPAGAGPAGAAQEG
jgi:hypothetical protein